MPPLSVNLCFAEFILANAAERANPILWQVFKSCSGGNTILRVTYFRVILITTDITNVLFHVLNCFFLRLNLLRILFQCKDNTFV